MPLVPMLISYTCTNITPNQMEACQKAFEAGTKQTELYQNDEKLEKYVMVYSKNKVETYFGQESLTIVGSGSYVYRTYKTKTLMFKLPTLGICDSANNQITPNSYSLNLSWRFPW